MGESQRIQVLLVEDSRDFAEYITILLAEPEGSQHDVRVASRLEDAVRMLREEPPDVILLDLNLPDSAGLETLERMVAAAPGTPVVVLTGQEDSAMGLEAVDLGAQDYMTKGNLDAEMLTTRLHYAIQRALALQRKMEIDQLQAMNEMKTRFINHVAHELQTPLTPIQFQLEALRRRELDAEERARALDMVDRNVQRLGHVVKQVLAVARMEAEASQGVEGPIDLNDVAAIAVASHAEEAEAAGVKLARERWDGPLIALGHDEALERALDELIENAIQACEEGDEVTLRLEADETHARLIVEDTGHGMDPELMGNLFQPFGHAHDTMERTQLSLGLGLYIATRLLERHGAELRGESEGIGKGSRFIIEMPRKAGRPDRQTS